MEPATSFPAKIRALIAEDELSAAVQLLRSFLGDSPRLNEALHQSGRFQYIRKQIRLGTVSHADATLTQNQIRFGLLDLLTEIEQEGTAPLPQELAQNLMTGDSLWADSLKQVLQKFVAVGSKPASIFQHYGWLIEEFLRKMETPAGREPSQRRLSFMAEAFQNSLRYLCFIQVAQILKQGKAPRHPLLSEFLQLEENEYLGFDYWNLLLIATDLLRDKAPFIPEIAVLVDELSDTKSDLYGTAVFLHHHRDRLLKNAVPENEPLGSLLDEYLTALVFWLRHISFLAKYRLVSIKDIHLKYRLGTAKHFVHQYGELHGIYTTEDYEYPEYSIENLFTYNQSVLLFKGSNVKDCLDHIGDESTYISLSPLVIDQSVFANKETQTPEIYTYTGCSLRQYHFAQYKNELAFGERTDIPSNKQIRIKAANISQPKYDELFEQMERVFKPFKTGSQI